MPFIYEADADTSALVISHVLDGINARVQKEAKLKGKGSDAYKQITKALGKHARRVTRLDVMTLAFIAHNPTLQFSDDDNDTATREISFPLIFTSQRRDGACFNEKAIPKIFAISRVLNGGTFTFYGKGEQSDNETTQGVVLALNAGITKGKLIANFLDRHMSDLGRGEGNYHNGGTQSSSSLRALEALGVVRKIDGTNWQIADKTRFSRLVEGAFGTHYTAPVDVVPVPNDAAAILDMPAPVLLLEYDGKGCVHLANTDADVSAFLAELLADGVDPVVAHEIVEAAV